VAKKTEKPGKAFRLAGFLGYNNNLLILMPFSKSEVSEPTIILNQTAVRSF
jgi:hypothetical protein